MDSIINKLGFRYRHNFNNFVDSIHKEYNKYIDIIKGYDVNIKIPSLSKLIYNIFETIPEPPNLTNITDITSKQYYTDGEGKLLSHDSWVKVISGLYRNHMARIIWKPPTTLTPGYFVARVYTGLGKPKLGQHIYDRSYTEDIKLWMTPGTSNSNCIISKFMITNIPDNSILFAMEGNGVVLPKEIRLLIKQQKITIILKRIHTKKTGGVSLLEKETKTNTELKTQCENINIHNSLIKPIAATIQAVEMFSQPHSLSEIISDSLPTLDV